MRARHIRASTFGKSAHTHTQERDVSEACTQQPHRVCEAPARVRQRGAQRREHVRQPHADATRCASPLAVSKLSGLSASRGIPGLAALLARASAATGTMHAADVQDLWRSLTQPHNEHVGDSTRHAKGEWAGCRLLPCIYHSDEYTNKHPTNQHCRSATERGAVKK
jgi:hypothetical protein